MERKPKFVLGNVIRHERGKSVIIGIKEQNSVFYYLTTENYSFSEDYLLSYNPLRENKTSQGWETKYGNWGGSKNILVIVKLRNGMEILEPHDTEFYANSGLAISYKLYPSPYDIVQYQIVDKPK